MKITLPIQLGLGTCISFTICRQDGSEQRVEDMSNLFQVSMSMQSCSRDILLVRVAMSNNVDVGRGNMSERYITPFQESASCCTQVNSQKTVQKMFTFARFR